MFNPKTVTAEEAIARRLITEFCEASKYGVGERTRGAHVASGRFAGACEVAAIALGASTPFAVQLDVAEAVRAFPACTNPPAAFPTARKEAVEAAVASLLAKWAS